MLPLKKASGWVERILARTNIAPMKISWVATWMDEIQITNHVRQAPFEQGNSVRIEFVVDLRKAIVCRPGKTPGKRFPDLAWARRLTAKRPLSRIACPVALESLRQTNIWHGDSETDVSEFTVIPNIPFGLELVTTVTPVRKCPIAARNVEGSSGAFIA